MTKITYASDDPIDRLRRLRSNIKGCWFGIRWEYHFMGINWDSTDRAILSANWIKKYTVGLLFFEFSWWRSITKPADWLAGFHQLSDFATARGVDVGPVNGEQTHGRQPMGKQQIPTKEPSL